MSLQDELKLASGPLVELLGCCDIKQISQQLLTVPYQKNCLGEGEAGEFDQFPLYRWDCFDCLTYINTIIALDQANDIDQFERNMAKINYREAVVKYQNRHHFMSVDWNIYNQRAGLVKDVTRQVLESGIEYAVGKINKPAWYQAKTRADIRITDTKQPAGVERLAALQAVSSQVQVESSRLAYISIEQLFSGRNVAKFCKGMPAQAVVEIVRPAWDLRAQIGTHLHVSHLGLAIKTQQGITFRHASERAGCVVECDLLAYLEAYKAHATVKGIHVLAYLG